LTDVGVSSTELDQAIVFVLHFVLKDGAPEPGQALGSAQSMASSVNLLVIRVPSLRVDPPHPRAHRPKSSHGTHVFDFCHRVRRQQAKSVGAGP